MSSVSIPTAPAHPLTKWVPGAGFVDDVSGDLGEPLTLSSTDIADGRESISALAYVANGTQNELGERLERIYAYLMIRPELRLVDVFEDIDGRRLREVARVAREHVNAIVTTADSFDGPEHLKVAEEILSYYGIRLIVIGSHGV